MAPIRRKGVSKAQQPPVKEEDYDAAIQELKTTLRITPKTAKHFCICYQVEMLIQDGMGYTTPDSLKSPKITPDSLEVQMQEYLERTNQTFQSAPKRSGAMYRVGFRRILWTARATEKEKAMYPERMSCNYWSNKAIAARDAAVQKSTKELMKMVDEKDTSDTKVEA